jgi:hypothetical protein
MAARRGSEPVVLKSPLLRLMLVLAPMASCGVFAAVPSEGWHPLAALAALAAQAARARLLPLQLAALLWALSRMPTATAVRPPAELMPPASAGWPPAGGSAGG